MDSTADLVVISQLDLLDTAGTPRGSIGNLKQSRIYRKPGGAPVHVPRTPSQEAGLQARELESGGDAAVEEEEGEEAFSERDTDQLVNPNASAKTLHEEKEKSGEQDPTILKSSSLEPPKTAFQTFVATNLGLFYMLFAACLFCCMSVGVKAMTKAAEQLPTLEIVFFRSVLVYFMGTAWMLRWGYEDWLLGPKDVRLLLVLRGVIGFGGLTCGWFALSMLNLADATVLGFLSPVFTAILARFILKEPYELIDGITGALSMIGVIFIARPSFLFGRTAVDATPDDLLQAGPSDFGSEQIPDDPSTASEFAQGYPSVLDPTSSTPATAAATVAASNEGTRILGVVIAITGALFGALVYIVVRRLKGRATPMHIVSTFSLMSVPLSLLFALVLPSPHPWILPQDPLTYMYLVLVSSSAFFGQIYLSKALHIETAGRASSMNYVQVVVAFLAEWALWGVQPSVWTLIGSAVVGSSVIAIAVWKMKSQRAK
ncbi:uncharacterized protein SPPG_01697 [Spizellomyces punctatus DAOM BR117]|uniref:EamA domain-containing protein n=1 Tax=Spizellomyces punctatus (strain DAOM BR117) TaxID=645134 RepID=A0A0L0HMH4_SPIPD|nr:uncharacterized protein SPPG_01697 [Spizellomyces punctatus DAOM BR117]KND02611.1 hypothetical protein SPPG_01697 [Spizellomyces punctatus DAOM BR117]|eukprot:XP_016610650.1 hypothetical protein SPPG_01697 [Spizellomyces punctatus DAOM BR117]